MTFPTVQDLTPTSFAANATAHLVAMPATVNAGDLLILLFSADDNPITTTPSGWTLLTESNALTPKGWVAYKRAVGDEDGTTVDVVTDSSQKACAQVYRITGIHASSNPEAGTIATGTSANPDSPTLTPSWGAEDTLWIAFYAGDDDDDASAYPTNYTDGTYTQSDDGFTNGSSMGTARRNLNATSDDPSTFTIAASRAWVANTIAIRPTGAAVVSPPMFRGA